ncbi:MAG: DUF5337 family protein [Pseudomonadota bacterium]
MTGPSQHDMAIARRQRRIGMVILGTFVTWALAQFVGARLGLPLRWIALVDLAALAALGWALVLTYGVWRMRREKE